MCRFEALVKIPKGFHFLVDSLLQGCPYLVQVVDEVGHGRKKTKVNKLSRRRTKTRQNTKRENRQKKRTRTQLMFSQMVLFTLIRIQVHLSIYTRRQRYACNLGIGNACKLVNFQCSIYNISSWIYTQMHRWMQLSWWDCPMETKRSWVKPIPFVVAWHLDNFIYMSMTIMTIIVVYTYVVLYKCS